MRYTQGKPILFHVAVVVVVLSDEGGVGVSEAVEATVVFSAVI
jgi:hypothetical protein